MARLKGLKPKLSKLAMNLILQQHGSVVAAARSMGYPATNLHQLLRAARIGYHKVPGATDKKCKGSGLRTRPSTISPLDRVFELLEKLGCTVDVRITLPQIDLLSELENSEPEPTVQADLPNKAPALKKDMVH